MTQPVDKDQDQGRTYNPATETPEERRLRAEGMVKSLAGIDAAKDQIKAMLRRRGRPSIVLTGEPGVGKTKMFNDLAKKIQEGTLPGKVISIDLTDLTKERTPEEMAAALDRITGQPGRRIGELAAQACHDGLPQSITPMKPLQIKRGFYCAM